MQHPKVISECPITTHTNIVSNFTTSCIYFVLHVQVIILDTPMSTLDPNSCLKVWDLLRAYRTGRTILLITQFVVNAQHLGNQVAVMANGRLQCCGTPKFLKQVVGKECFWSNYCSVHLIIIRREYEYMCVCMYVFMYVCIYVYMCVCI